MGCGRDGSFQLLHHWVHAKDYFNRKGFHSIVLQRVVDHQCKFMDVYIGWPGSVHDTRVLANSRFVCQG